MATGVNVKMGVTGVTDFKKSMQDAQAAVKNLDEQLKLNESQLKANGDQELYLENQAKILQDRIDAQTRVVQAANSALEELKSNGIDPTSKKFQDMQGKVYAATSKLVDMKVQLKDVESSTSGSAEGLKGMNDSINDIKENGAWENVAEGIGKITDTLERGARAAYNFGKRIISSLKGSSGWADDLQTLSDAYDIPMDKLQRMEKVSHIVEMDAESILKAQDKMSHALASSDDRKDISDLLGIKISGNEDPESLMWNIGDALLHMENALSRNDTAQKIFGRSWRELVPLFKTGRAEYEKMLSKQDVLTDEQILNLTKAEDTIAEMELKLQTLKNQFWSENADKITSLLQWLMDHQNEVIDALTVIGGGFAALKIADVAADVERVINGLQKLGILKSEAPTQVTTTTTGGTGGNWATGLLEKIGMAGASGFLWRENERLRQIFNENLVGLTVEEQQAKALQQTLGISQEELNHWGDQHLNEDPMSWTGRGHSFGEDEVIHRDRRHQSYFEGGEYYDRSLDRMAAIAEQTSANEIQSNSEVTAALGNLQGLPAAISAAVQSGMARVNITISEGAVGAIGRKVGKQMGNSIKQYVK